MPSDLLKGQLDLMLLRVLQESPGHGYSVISRLRDRSGGAFDLPEGTVYPALHRLEDEALLASEWEARDGRRRRVYRLTGAGASALVIECSRWEGFVSAVQSVLAPPAPSPA